MRAREFIWEESDSSQSDNDSLYSDVIMVLGQIQSDIERKEMPPTLRTDLVVAYIQNAGLDGFSYDDLVDANENSDAVKSVLKKITPDTVTFNTGDDHNVENPEDYESGVDNPEEVVSGMAKSALKRRQD